MVVFTCNTCSAVLKRNKVDSHCYQCRGCESLSCVDCGKDFWGDEYQTHTKCISEEEKYGRKDAAPKLNKGEQKQDQWIEQVQDAIEKASSKPSLKRLLERIKQCPNIPRKKVKFENFVKNSIKCHDTNLIADSWDVLMTSKTQAQAENKKETIQEAPSSLANSHKDSANGDSEADDEVSKSTAVKNKKEKKEERRKKSQKKEKKDKATEVPIENTGSDIASKKSKKRKRHETDDEEEDSRADEKENKKKNKKKRNKADGSIANDADEECNGNDKLEEAEEEEDEPPRKRKKTKFDWEKVIKAVLEKKGELTLKKLKKKVLNEFAAQDAANYSEENLSAKFDKKIKTINGVKVFKDRATLKS